MASSKNGNDSKVFDVSKPGKAKPSIGTKPMIVGHKSVSIDPMMRDKTSDQSDDTADSSGNVKVTTAPKLSPTKSKIKVEPISEDLNRPTDKFKKASSAETEEVSDKLAAEKESPKKTTTVSNSSAASAAKSALANMPGETSTTAVVPIPPKNQSAQAQSAKSESTQKTADKKNDPAVVAQERIEKIRKLAENKQYHVDIRGAHSGPLKSFIIAFMLVTIVGFAALYVLVDTGVLDVNAELPYRIFSE